MKWLFLACLIFFFTLWGCGSKTEEGSSEYDTKTKTTQVSDADVEFQSALTTMQRLNSDLQTNYKIYVRSNKNGDIIDEIETNESRESIISEANNLITFCNDGLSKDYIINSVANSRNTYLDYKKAAEEILEKVK